MKNISKLSLLTIAAFSLCGCSLPCDKNAFLKAIDEIYRNPIPEIVDVEYNADIVLNGEAQKYNFKKSEISYDTRTIILVLSHLMHEKIDAYTTYSGAKYYKGSTYKVVVNGDSYIDVTGVVHENPDVKFTVKFDKYGNTTYYDGYISDFSSGKITATYTYAKSN